MKRTLFCFILIFNFSFLIATAQDDAGVKPDSVYNKVQQQPTFPGGLSNYLASHIVYPETERSSGISGKVFVTFIVEKDGTVSNVQLLRGAPGGPGLDSEALRVMRAMPKWTPAMLNGNPVRVQFNVPIDFELQDSVNTPAPAASTSKPADTASDNKIFLIVQEEPKFYGDLNKYLSAHIVYPEAEREAGKTGKVFVTFVIEKDGSVSNVKILKGAPNAPGFDSAALTVVRNMPAWSPGIQNGRPVRVQYNLPIDFELHDNAPGSGGVYSMADVNPQPQYPGGNPATYLYSRLTNDKPDIQQEVFVSFIVEKDGSVTGITVTNGSTSQLIDDITKTLNSMDKWTPGYKDGAPVRVKYYIKLESENRNAAQPHPHNDSFGE